ncbi:iron-sulfur cluster repair di-iron protein [Bacillus sp. FJAT-47783]|uniref:iron-sulfur cluster repair di-iron protein n=1 Tax=Bacillus sp. FJAT-47783 TaxID=2922712 RepID=UPI001FAE3221|nr:iron-sulfur cluster repair di-iron protein [Bacillus sp. FJAT-47783]
MEKTFTEQSTVGEIVAAFPKSSDFFKSNRIDFCCGGNRPLKEALTEKNLPVEDIVQQLNEQFQNANKKVEKNWEEATYSELIEHIVHKHHRYLNEELPQLSPYVTKVLRVHGGEQPHLVKIHKLFNELKTELEQHLMKEEVQAFPLILHYEQEPTPENEAAMKKVIFELVSEHDKAGDIIKEMRDITNDFTPPAHACGTYRLVYNRLEALESDLFEHIHLENNILFPRILND